MIAREGFNPAICADGPKSFHPAHGLVIANCLASLVFFVVIWVNNSMDSFEAYILFYASGYYHFLISLLMISSIMYLYFPKIILWVTVFIFALATVLLPVILYCA